MLTYCEKCHKVLDKFDIANRKVVMNLKGIPYEFFGKEAVCPTCGETVLNAQIMKYNQEKLYDVYRNENNIISVKDILSIPEKYQISKRSISKYLGWGEVTFSRYCSGYIPTKHNSDILKEVLADPEYLKERIRKYIQDNPDDETARKDLQKLNFSGLFHAVVTMSWDDEIDQWTAASKDIPGLELQSDSFDCLAEQVKSKIPELLRQNNLPNMAMIEFRTNMKELVYA